MLAASGILIALAFAQDLRTQFFWNYKVQQTPVGQIAFHSGEVADKYSWLAAHTTAGDLIFEARQPYVYFPLQLRNPTRMGQIWPSDYTRPEQVQQVILDLKNNPPRFILWDTSYSKSAESRPAGDHLAPLYEFLTKEYDRSGLAWTSPNGYSVEAWEIKANSPK